MRTEITNYTGSSILDHLIYPLGTPILLDGVVVGQTYAMYPLFAGPLQYHGEFNNVPLGGFSVATVAFGYSGSGLDECAGLNVLRIWEKGEVIKGTFLGANRV